MNRPENLKVMVSTDAYIDNPAKIYSKGAIVFPKNGAAVSTNKKRILGQDSVVDLNTGGFLADGNQISTAFLFYLLQNVDFKQYVRGGAVPTLDLKELKNKECHLPPIPEQERIVAELDLLQGIIDKQKAQLKELDTLAKSIFYDMFGDPVENEKGWRTEALKVVAPQKTYDGPVPSINGKYWLLNLDKVEQQTGRIIEYVLATEDEIGSSTMTFDTSNILYSKLRPYLNKVVIPDSIGYGTSELVPLRPIPSLLNRVFFAYLLRSRSFVDFISVRVAGAKMPRVSMEALRDFPIILPPLSIQQSFATKIEAIERQKASINASIAETQKLFDYTMDKYFG